MSEQKNKVVAKLDDVLGLCRKNQDITRLAFTVHFQCGSVSATSYLLASDHQRRGEPGRDESDRVRARLMQAIDDAACRGQTCCVTISATVEAGQVRKSKVGVEFALENMR